MIQGVGFCLPCVCRTVFVGLFLISRAAFSGTSLTGPLRFERQFGAIPVGSVCEDYNRRERLDRLQRKAPVVSRRAPYKLLSILMVAMMGVLGSRVIEFLLGLPSRLSFARGCVRERARSKMMPGAGSSL